MTLLFLQDIFPAEVLRAFGWTLVHSLWLGLIAALLSALIIIGTRRSAAITRYNLLGTVFLLFIAAVVISFITELGNQQVAASSFQQPVNTSIQVLSITIDKHIAEVPAYSMIDEFARWFNNNLNWILFVWLLLFSLNGLKLMVGLASVDRLRKYKTNSVEENWNRKLRELSLQLGIRKAASLLESASVKIPVMIGHFKPIILVPVGMISGLTAEQVETVLLHELGHIRRNDYLVNLFQRFIEALFFFNPALLWVSSLIRQEREACCDDIVIANTTYRRSYLDALVAFQEYSVRDNGYAMAIGQHRYLLLNRVKRMITKRNTGLGIMERTILLAVVIFLTAFGFMPAQKAIAEPSLDKSGIKNEHKIKTRVAVPARIRATTLQLRPKAIIKKTLPVLIDTIPTIKKDTITRTGLVTIHHLSRSTNQHDHQLTETINALTAEGKSYILHRVNNQVVSLVVENKLVKESELKDHREVIAQIDAIIAKQKTGNGRKIKGSRDANGQAPSTNFLAQHRNLAYQKALHDKQVNVIKEHKKVDSMRKVNVTLGGRYHASASHGTGQQASNEKEVYGKRVQGSSTQVITTKPHTIAGSTSGAKAGQVKPKVKQVIRL